MKDVAAERDGRGVDLAQVGIKDLHLPVMIRQRDGEMARVLGQVDASVELPHYERGTHMSRFVETLNHWSKRAVAGAEMEEILAELRSAFEAPRAQMRLGFKYFLPKRAPASGIVSQLDYDCSFEGRLDAEGYTFTLGAAVPVITLCPCSKEISARGAHSQRATLTARLRSRAGSWVWLEELIPLLEAQGSAEIFPVLKRVDEKVITEASYDNPKFVEDVVRDSYLALAGLAGVTWFSVQCESHESIHNHIAYAYAEKRGDRWP
jgi:GTP cyclohydrolase I